MAYIINYSGGTISIPVGTADTSNTSLTLIGRNWTSSNIDQGFGQALNQNFVSLLENFADASPPPSPLQGQLWYDTSTTVIKLNVGTSTTPSWLDVYTAGAGIATIGNGTSTVSVPVVNGDVNISSGGTANVLVVTPTGVDVYGTLTSNTSISSPRLISTVNDGTTSPLTVTSSVRVNNLNADLLDGYHANTTKNAVGQVVVRNITTGVIDNDIVGNLTGNVTGNVTGATISVTGNITGANLISTNNITGANLSVTGNITSANLSVTGKSNLNEIGNVIITGGTSGQFLQTNGSGVLTWATVGTSGVANGTSSVSIPAVNGNVNTSVGGIANVLVVTTTGANVAGTVNATGNITGGNLITTGSVNTTRITSGANTPAGTITGDWTLTTGSKLNATYADLAEYYAIDEGAGPATVVEFGGDCEIRICMTDMSRRVAGVVSTNPAFIMNDTVGKIGQHRELIALQGRVPCKVVGLVSKGDMMVSAGDGCARSESDPVLGSVIGKALEDKDTLDMGIIEVAVGRL